MKRLLFLWNPLEKPDCSTAELELLSRRPKLRQERPNEQYREWSPSTSAPPTMQSHSNWNLLLLLLCLLKLQDSLSSIVCFCFVFMLTYCDNVFSLETPLSASFLEDALFTAHLNMFLRLRAHQFAKLINNLFVAVKCVMRVKAALQATSFSIFYKQF